MNTDGQILLVVVLVMVVVLTVGLSLASRTITNLKISKQSEESARAFQAAEAGIEQTLQSKSQSSGNLSNNATFSTTYTPSSGNELLLNNGEELEQNIGSDVWLSNYPDYTSPFTGTLTIYWGNGSQSSCFPGQGKSTAPALEIVSLSSSKDNPVFNKTVVEPYSCGFFSNRIRGAGTLRSDGPGALRGQAFQYSTTISVSGGLLMKIIPLFNSAKIGIKSNSGPLPAQGSVVESTGQSGDTVRKVVYFASYPQMPIELFPYSYVSQ